MVTGVDGNGSRRDRPWLICEVNGDSVDTVPFSLERKSRGHDWNGAFSHRISKKLYSFVLLASPAVWN